MGEKRPVVLDLYCGRFGWGKAFAAEGYRVVGFDIVQAGPVPDGCELVLQDVRTLDASRLALLRPAVVVASSPCEEFTRHMMPWTRRRNPPFPHLGIELFRTAEKLAADIGCPIVLENVREAQRFVGTAKTHWGHQYLWGDVPALLPQWSEGRQKQSRSSSAAGSPGGNSIRACAVCSSCISALMGKSGGGVPVVCLAF